MVGLAPPNPPIEVTLGGDDEHSQLRLRLHQWTWTMATVLGAAWLCTQGWIPGIIGLAVAKHVLVAVLLMGAGVDAPRKADPR